MGTRLSDILTLKHVRGGGRSSSGTRWKDLCGWLRGQVIIIGGTMRFYWRLDVSRLVGITKNGQKVRRQGS